MSRLSIFQSTSPVGAIEQYSGSSVPQGWLACDGSAVSRTQYQSLFNTIGTSYGNGDGSTTFNLPDLRGRTPIGEGQGPSLSNRSIGESGGEEEHTISETEMPNHDHGYTRYNQYVSLAGGAGSYPNCCYNNSNQTTTATGSGNAHNNMQPYSVVKFMIKF